MTVRVLLAALGASALLGSGAFVSQAGAQEVIAAGPKGAPPAAEAAPGPGGPAVEDQNSPKAIGAWGRRVLAGAPAADGKAADPAVRPGCAPPPDRKPHGAVWAGVGSGGYREVGGVVTEPLGDCGQLTVGVSKVEGRFRRGW